jgi:NitT/TauT family transport system substrate-binding protein
MKRCIFNSVLALWMALSATAQAETIVLAVPGPGPLSYLPVYLAKAIGADRDEGIELKLRYFSNGPLAMRDLMNNNSDFMAIGMPAIAAGRADGLPIVAVGQLSQSAMFVLLLRSGLKNQVHSLAQLKGKGLSIGTAQGIASNTSTQRSQGYMLTEYLLQRNGLNPNDPKDAQFVSAGQTREAQASSLARGTVDVLMGDEPFASELVQKGIAVRLVDLYPPKSSREQIGGTLIHATVATREDIYTQHPDTVKKIQLMFDRTLLWMSTHSAQEIIGKLSGQPGFESAAQNKLVADKLQHNPGMFTKRIAWNAEALATTEKFFHSVATTKAESALLFGEFVRGEYIHNMTAN